MRIREEKEGERERRRESERDVLRYYILDRTLYTHTYWCYYRSYYCYYYRHAIMYIIISERGAILRASNIITRLLRMSYYIVRDYARGWQDTPRVAVRDSTRPSKDKQIANEL